MKNKNYNPMMYMNAEEFCFIIKTKPFCDIPKKYDETTRFNFESAMDQKDNLMDEQESNIYYNYSYTLLKDKKVKVNEILFLEIVNQ